jgi:hypothetical protein
MRVMVIVKATRSSEAGAMPSEKLLADMGRFNEELVTAGVMLAGEGLHPSRKGKRVRFADGTRTVVGGPGGLTAGLRPLRRHSSGSARQYSRRGRVTGRAGLTPEDTTIRTCHSPLPCEDPWRVSCSATRGRGTRTNG